MAYSLIRAKAVRQLVKEGGKRCGHTFLSALDMCVYEKVKRCLAVHNGNRKTMDDSLINLTK